MDWARMLAYVTALTLTRTNPPAVNVVDPLSAQG
jgi:hypothetical protein